jgi:hypothetical protein
MRNLDEPQPAAASGPESETLDSDMRPADIADALARLRFRNGPLLIPSRLRALDARFSTRR